MDDIKDFLAEMGVQPTALNITIAETLGNLVPWDGAHNFWVTVLSTPAGWTERTLKGMEDDVLDLSQ